VGVREALYAAAEAEADLRYGDQWDSIELEDITSREGHHSCVAIVYMMPATEEIEVTVKST
jgi:hypothetical protein